jgi:hypothetical protein
MLISSFSPDRLITAKDHASVQFTVIDVDENGRALSTGTNIALCGQVRAQGESDDSINRVATRAGRAFPQLTPFFPFTHELVYSAPQRLAVFQVIIVALCTTPVALHEHFLSSLRRIAPVGDFISQSRSAEISMAS